MKEQLSIESSGEEVLGVLQTPEEPCNKPLVIFLHGWTGERTGPNRTFVKASRRIIEEGYPVLRFDFRGSGDSDGSLEEQTITGMLKDLDSVIDRLSGREDINCSEIALIGHSMGGYVSLLHTARDNRVETVILWMGRAYDTEKAHGEPWKKEIERRGFYISNGHKFTEKYYKDGKSYSSEDAMEKIDVPTGLIYGGFDEKVPPAEGQYAKSHLGEKAELEIIETLDHLIRGEYNQEAVIDQTVEWLREWL